MSGVICNLSGVMGHMFRVKILGLFFFLQSVGVSWWSLPYQPGLPRLLENIYIYY